MSAKAWDSRRYKMWYVYPYGLGAHDPFCPHKHVGNTPRIRSARCRRLARVTRKKK